MTGWRRPWVIDGAMNSEMFTLYAETRLVPTLREGDVVILDNLSSHKAPAPRPQGNGGGYGKLAGVTGWIEARVADKGGITLDELAAEPARTHGIDVHRGTVWRALRGLGLAHKKRPSGA